MCEAVGEQSRRSSVDDVLSSSLLLPSAAKIRRRSSQNMEHLAASWRTVGLLEAGADDRRSSSTTAMEQLSRGARKHMTLSGPLAVDEVDQPSGSPRSRKPSHGARKQTTKLTVNKSTLSGPLADAVVRAVQLHVNQCRGFRPIPD